MGQTPGDYLCRLRMALARDRLRRGQGLKQAAAAVGFTRTSLLRALAVLNNARHFASLLKRPNLNIAISYADVPFSSYTGQQETRSFKFGWTG